MPIYLPDKLHEHDDEKPSSDDPFGIQQECSREEMSSEKLSYALTLPFNPNLTTTIFNLEKFEDLDVSEVRRYSAGMLLDVVGTLVPGGSNKFAPEVVEKLREIRAKMKVCIYSNSTRSQPIFDQLHIPVVKHAPPKPDPRGFERAAHQYLDLNPYSCVMVGDNLLTDGGARQVGMKLVLVNPLPGTEGLKHKLSRGYGRLVKRVHDRIYGTDDTAKKEMKQLR